MILFNFPRTQWLLKICFIVLLSLKANAQSPNWVWAKWGGTKYIDYLSDIKNTQKSANGHSYIVGYFTDTLLIPPFSLTSTSHSDLFVAYYDPNGNCIWVKNSSGNSDDFAWGASITPSGENVIVVGGFTDTLVLGATTLISNGNYDIFITEIDINGNFLWAKSYGGPGWELANHASIDTSNNFIYIAGTFSDTTSIGTITLSAYGGLGIDIFLAKCDMAGNVIWAVSAGGPGSDQVFGSCTDMYGNTYITGHYTDSLFFGPYQINSIGDKDIYTAKCDPNGNFLWAKSFGGYGQERGRGITSDAFGDVYVTGNFWDTAYFGTTVLASHGLPDAFIAKYDISGKEEWIIRIGGPSEDMGMDIASDRNGNIYICGTYRDWILFSDSEPIPAIPAIAFADIFVAKYDSSSQLKWWKVAGGPDWEDVRGISIDPSKHAHIIGLFDSTCIFDAINLSNYSQQDWFLAKLDNTVFNSIDEEIPVNNLLIFPNPFSTQTIFQSEIPLKNATLSINNIFGQTVKQIKNISGQTTILQRNDLPAGLYFVRLTEDNKQFLTKKIIIVD